MAIRKNITLSESEYSIIQNYCHKIGVFFSELLRKNTLKEIKKSEEISSLEFLNSNCSYIDDTEQKELGKILSNVDLKDESCVELPLNWLL